MFTSSTTGPRRGWAGRLARTALPLGAAIMALPMTWASSAYASPTLALAVFDDGTAVSGTLSSGTGTLAFSGGDANFGLITVNIFGVPSIPSPDLGTMNSQLSTALGFSGTHTIDIIATQSGLSGFLGGGGTTTMTYNALIGSPSPATQTMSFDGNQIANQTFLSSDGPSQRSTFYSELGPIPGTFSEFAGVYSHIHQRRSGSVCLAAVRGPGAGQLRAARRRAARHDRVRPTPPEAVILSARAAVGGTPTTSLARA